MYSRALFTFCISVTWIGQVKYLSIRYFLCQYLFISCCFIKNTAPLHWGLFVHLCQFIILYLFSLALSPGKSIKSWIKQQVCIFCILVWNRPPNARLKVCGLLCDGKLWILCDDFSEQTLAVITTCELLIYCWPLEMNKIRCRTLRVCVHSARAVRCWDSAEMPELTNQLLMRADPLLSWPRCQTRKEMLFWSISSEGKHRSSTMEVSNSQKLTVDLVERESDWCIVAYQTSIWFEATQCWTV